MKKLYGVVVPIITPFDENDRIDIASVENLTEHIIREKLHAIYPCGTTGEMLLLDIEERKQIAETVVHTAAGRINVFVQAGAMTLRDTLELARHAHAVGADGIGVVTPSFFKISDKGLFDYYKTISDSLPADFPIYLYAIPQNAINDISPELAGRIAEACPNVVGIKFSCPDMTKIQQFMLIRDETFSVLVGSDHLFQAAVQVGGNGVVSGNAQVLCKYYLKIWNAMQEHDENLATRWQRKTNELNAVLCKINGIAAFKEVLKSKGVIKTARMRKPMETLSCEELAALMKELQALHYCDL